MPRLGLARGEKEKIELEIAAKKTIIACGLNTLSAGGGNAS